MTMASRPWAENLLVAYVDGELEPAQAAEVEATLREDAEARAIVGVLRRSAAAVRSAYDQPLPEPVPARLLAALQAPPARRAASLPDRARRSGVQRALLPLAASILALAIGFGAGYLQFGSAQAPLRPAAGPAEDPASARFEATLYRALETQGEGEVLGYADAERGLSGKVTVLGPLATRSGDRCREFRHETAGPTGMATSHGIACRSPDGGWSVLTMPPARGMAPAGS